MNLACVNIACLYFKKLVRISYIDEINTAKIIFSVISVIVKLKQVPGLFQ